MVGESIRNAEQEEALLGKYLAVTSGQFAHQRVADALLDGPDVSRTNSVDQPLAMSRDVEAVLRRSMPRKAFEAGYISLDEVESLFSSLFVGEQFLIRPSITDLVGWGVYQLRPPGIVG